VALFGKGALQADCLGGFALQPERESGGRPVYRKGTEDKFLWFFEGWWRVGLAAGTGRSW
jgi:hypothetical protein